MLHACPHGKKYKALKYQASESYHDFKSKTKPSEDAENGEHFSAWLLRRCVQDDNALRLLDEKGKHLVDLLLAHEERLNQIDGQDIDFTKTTTGTGRSAIETHPFIEPHDHYLKRSMTAALMKAHPKTNDESGSDS